MSSLPETIADRYVVKEVIGSGGMGQVLRAHDPHLAIDVAIKLLHKNDIDTTAARLQREAVAAGKLNHKNIARVYNFGQTADGEPYMVMEFVQGVTLADLIKKESHLPVNKAIEIFIQICSGLQLAHANNIVHRDLKPSNIMLADNPDNGGQEAKILDFGVAKLDQVSQKLTSTSAIIGSPLYMSPEQASALDIDLRSDIYSFGCLMFETLTGIVPLKGKSALETISLHRGKAPPLISDVIEHGEFPERLVDLINRCLAKLPEQRPQTAIEISDELKFIHLEIDQKALEKPPANFLQTYIPKTKVKSLLIVLGCVGLVGLIIFGATKFLFDKQERVRVRIEKRFDTSEDQVDDIETAKKETFKKAVDSRPTALYPIFGGGQGLSFKKFTIDYEIKPELEKYPNLRGVVFKDCMLLKGPGLKYLANTKIEQIQLERVKLNDDSLKYLLPVKTLILISLSSPNLTDKGVEILAQKKNLEQLMLGSDLLTDHAAELIATLPKIGKVELASKQITDKSVDYLQSKKIWSLSLLNTSVSENVGVKIAKMPIVKEVILTGTKKISPASLQALSNAQIYQLNLADVPLTRKHFEIIAQNKSLAQLTFQAYPDCYKDVEALGAISHPFEMSLRKSKYIDDKLIDAITKLPVVSLDLEESNLTDKQLIKLAKTKTLQILKVRDCPLVTVYGDEGFHRFFKLMWKRDCKLEVRMNPSVIGLTEQLRPVEEYRENAQKK